MVRFARTTTRQSDGPRIETAGDSVASGMAGGEGVDVFGAANRKKILRQFSRMRYF